MLGTLMVRLPSVFAVALLPWVVWRARPNGPRILPWGPLLVVTWLPLLYLGTEARAYALLALVNAVLWIRGPDWVERGGRWTAAFAGLAASLPLLHYTGAVSFLALSALAIFVSVPRRRALWIALGGAALPMLAWSPILFSAPRASMAWVETAAGPGRPGVATVSVLSPAGPFPALFEAPPSPLAPWLSTSILVLLVCGAGFGLLKLRGQSDERAGDAAVATRLVIGLLPAVAVGLLSLGGTPAYFAGRTESMVWSLAAALIAILIGGQPAIARVIFASSYVLVGAATVAAWIVALPARPPAPGVAVGRSLAPMVEDGDRVIVAGLWQLEVRHGLAKSVLDGSAAASEIIDVETIPRSQGKHPGWLDRDAMTSPALLQEARALREIADEEERRIWLVWSPLLPLEDNFFPAFAGWQRSRAGAGPMIVVDLLAPKQQK